MYAAAGGASLASRQARQKQRQQKKSAQLQAKLHPPKAAAVAVAEHGASTPTRQSRQFHNLPNNYLRTPQAQGRKLSASYTAHSKLLLPIDEGDTQSVLHMRVQAHSHAHSHHAHSHTHQDRHQMLAYTGHGYHGRTSPKLAHRHSGSGGTGFQHAHLPKSATATLPLVSQVEATPPTSPSGVAVAKTTDEESGKLPASGLETSVALSYHDSIIVTPATPMASPGHVARPHDDLSDAAAEKQPLTSAVDSCDDDDRQYYPPTGQLERKCSVYRMRRSNAFEGESVAAITGMRRQLKELQFNQPTQHYEPLLTDDPHLIFKGFSATVSRKIQLCAYCEEGICVCEHIECAQGRAAWLERGRRCSVQEAQQQATCHRRWVKRNRIQDASLGGSSDDDDFLGVLRGPSTFANAFLYVGLGTVALGLVIAFVGTGEKGFKTVELRLIGPSLIGIGLICCLLRILFCICPSHCIANSKNARKKAAKADADHTTSLLRGESKRVSIARGPNSRYPITQKRSNSKMLNEGMEALRQIATTSLFMQNEQKPMSNRIVPIIKEPETSNSEKMKVTDKMVCSSSSGQHKSASNVKCEPEPDNNVPTIVSSKLEDRKSPVYDAINNKSSYQRVSVHQQPPPPPSSSCQNSSFLEIESLSEHQMETSLMFVRNPNLEKEIRKSSMPPEASNQNLKTDSTHLSLHEASTLPSVHTAKVPHSLSYMSSNSPANSASTYAAALASSRSHSERSESLVRGPLAMPLHVLAASAPSYVTSSSSSTRLGKSSVLSALPSHAATSHLNEESTTDSHRSDQQYIPGQIQDISLYPSALATVPSARLTSDRQKTVSLNVNTAPQPSSAYASLSSKNISDSLPFPTSTSSSSTTTTASHLNTFEPELLLSPAKLGQ